jgi:CRP/FNR family cyclic AMP-dependent transcriptional regulator
LKISSQEKGDSEFFQYLKNVPLLTELNDKTLKSIIRESRQVSYTKGKLIMKEGDQSVVFHIILDGSVVIVKNGEQISRLGKGEFFGEMGLFTGRPRSADVVALEPTKCLALTAWAFRSYLRHNPTIAFEVIRTLAERLASKDAIKSPGD